MKFQSKNGSLFNSPSTTAVSLSHTQDTGCAAFVLATLISIACQQPAYLLHIFWCHDRVTFIYHEKSKIQII